MTDDEQALEQRVKGILMDILGDARPLPVPVVSQAPASVTEVVVGMDREVRVRVTCGGGAHGPSDSVEPVNNPILCPDPPKQLLDWLEQCLSEEDHALLNFIACARSLSLEQLLCLLLVRVLTLEARRYAAEQGIVLPTSESPSGGSAPSGA